MILGLITDVHNDAARLEVALKLFHDRGVDQVLTIGDTCDAFSRGDSTAAARVATLLQENGVQGVWGNHDFSLCQEVSELVRSRFPSVVLEVMSRMQPRLIMEECYFSHKDSSVDPYDVAQLWDISDTPPDLSERAGLAFHASPVRFQFVGHYHRWWAATTHGTIDWTGNETLRFDPEQRYFVVVTAVCNGWCAHLDTNNWELEPLHCDTN